MLAGRRKKNACQRLSAAVDPLPPRQITARTLAMLGLRPESNTTEEVLTVLNHFAYGASMGGIYGTLSRRQSAQRQSTLSAAATGVVYGLGVWAGSYLGWLPATGLYRSATEDSPERNVRMVVAHVVWGGTLGIVTEMTGRLIAKATRTRSPKTRVNGAKRDDHPRHIAKPR